MTNFRDYLDRAAEIIEAGDQRLLASDGSAGGRPPDISLDEWRELYRCIVKARDLSTKVPKLLEMLERITDRFEAMGDAVHTTRTDRRILKAARDVLSETEE